jgi:ABC-type multidrug transport system ATPase subunit
MKIIDVNDLTKAYAGRSLPAVDNASFAVSPGEIIAVIGHNGAGKSSLFDIVGGLMAPTSGRVTLGVSTSQIGWCPQREIVDWSLTVRQNIALGLDMRSSVKSAERRLAVHDVSLAMGLEPFLDRTAETLSGGELRRTQIARAMVGNPELMILDEPTTGLDPTGIETVFSYLDQRRSAGASALISTHETSRFSGHCTRVIAMEEGRIIADMSTARFMDTAPGSDDLWAAYLLLRSASAVTDDRGRT